MLPAIGAFGIRDRFRYVEFSSCECAREYAASLARLCNVRVSHSQIARRGIHHQTPDRAGGFRRHSIGKMWSNASATQSDRQALSAAEESVVFEGAGNRCGDFVGVAMRRIDQHYDFFGYQHRRHQQQCA